MITLAKTTQQLFLVCLLSVLPWFAAAQVDLFLQIDGIKGESKDAEYTDSIEILSWSEGMSAPVQLDTGGGGSSGKVTAQSISIAKFIDSASPELRFNLARGELMETASIIVRKRLAEESYELFRIDLTDVRLDGVSASAAAGQDQPVENISLFFTKIKWTYTPIDRFGRPGTKIIRGWDFAKNVAF